MHIPFPFRHKVFILSGFNKTLFKFSLSVSLKQDTIFCIICVPSGSKDNSSS